MLAWAGWLAVPWSFSGLAQARAAAAAAAEAEPPHLHSPAATQEPPRLHSPATTQEPPHLHSTIATQERPHVRSPATTQELPQVRSAATRQPLHLRSAGTHEPSLRPLLAAPPRDGVAPEPVRQHTADSMRAAAYGIPATRSVPFTTLRPPTRDDASPTEPPTAEATPPATGATPPGQPPTAGATPPGQPPTAEATPPAELPAAEVASLGEPPAAEAALYGADGAGWHAFSPGRAGLGVVSVPGGDSLVAGADVVALERARIAGEVHDAAGHGLAAIAMQAGLALVTLDDDPEQARASLRAIRETSTTALAQLRAALDGIDPPGRDLAGLIDGVRAAGLSVDVEPPHPAVPAHLQDTVYRVVRESLTNVLRHAGPTRAVVRAAGDRREFVLEVSDRGTGWTGSGEGRGLTGMRARVTGTGGQFTAGPREGGGFQVVARFPQAST
ncbi:histidine kinase [Nonomuraea insulae]|uniref:histidine kinase n=1 Tax=Nonomuraea insulae TaxID=1616787 RepID=A0ABW1D600_9ACTN